MNKKISLPNLVQAIIPVLAYLMWVNLVKQFPEIFYHSVNFYYGMIFIISGLSTFLSSLFFPPVKNFQNAIKLTTPLAITFFIDNSLIPFLSVDWNNWLEDMGFKFLWAFVVSPPMNLLLILITMTSHLFAYKLQRYFGTMNTR